MLRRFGIAGRMTALVLAGAGCILGAIVGGSYLTTREMMEKELAEKAGDLAQATANRIETVETSVEKIIGGLALALESGPMDDTERTFGLLTKVVEENRGVYGAAVAPDPGASSGGAPRAAPYACRRKEGLVRMDLAAGNYNYEIWDWYTIPKELGRPVWSEPYFDEGAGNILMATYSKPIFLHGEDRRFWGVVTGDVSLEWLTSFLKRIRVGEGGYAFLVSGNGTFICHPLRDLIMNETVFSLAEARGDDPLRKLGRRMIRGESDVVPWTSLATQTPSLLAFTPISSTNWSLGVAFPRDEIMAKVFRLSQIQLFLGASGFALLLVVVVAIARSITGPLRQLDGATQVLATGNLDAPLPSIAREDEVAHLALSFATMRQRLKVYMKEIETTTAARERIESEFSIARSIQMSLVPKTFPPFPDRDEFEIFATLDPAREIGGDLYDFCLIGDSLYLMIGDVAGKGLPAALYMAVVRTFLKAFVDEQHGPAMILSRLNAELAKENDLSMFVTLFCASIDLSTGTCRYASGGHNPPYFIPRESRGPVAQVPHVPGVAIGALEGVQFGETEIQFRPGDTLFLYTDGVTETMNREDELFSEERTVQELERLRGRGCADILKEMRETLRRFAAGAAQSDDITMMAFTFRGRGPGTPPG